MGSVNLAVIIKSIRTIITRNNVDETNDFHVPSIVTVTAALGAKVLLFIYCISVESHLTWSFRVMDKQVRASARGQIRVDVKKGG